MGSTIALSKAEFVDRVALWANRYGVNFGKGRLDEWIKQGLAFRSDPPKHKFGCPHYRRVLRLMRFYSFGVKDRDEILVQLFIRGYGVKSHEVREALLKEFRKTRAKLNSAIRSVYADRSGEIPTGRQKQFRHELGQPDPRLVKTGMVPSDAFIFEAVRAARNPDEQNITPLVGGQELNPLQAAQHALKAVITGMLAQDDEHPTEVEALITRSGPQEYEQAKNNFKAIRELFRMYASSDQTEIADASEATIRSLTTRDFSAFFLVMTLKLVASESSQSISAAQPPLPSV